MSNQVPEQKQGNAFVSIGLALVGIVGVFALVLFIVAPIANRQINIEASLDVFCIEHSATNSCDGWAAETLQQRGEVIEQCARQARYGTPLQNSDRFDTCLIVNGMLDYVP